MNETALSPARRWAITVTYRETQTQAQVLAFIDDFRLLAVMYAGLVILILLMRRVQPEPSERSQPVAERALPSAAAE